MPNSLKCRLKKLKHQSLLSEKDLNRIIIVPDNTTNGDMIKALFPNFYYTEGRTNIYYNNYPNGSMQFKKDWWNAPYKLSKLKGENK